MFNLATHFLDRHLAEGRGSHVAMVCQGQAHTYADLAGLANRVGNGLRSLGVEKGERVLLVLPDGPEFAAAYFGCAKIGAVAVPASTALRTADYAYFIAESEVRALLVHAGLWPVVEAAAQGLHAVVAGAPQPGRLSWDDWLAQEPSQLEAAGTSENDVAFWLWTSGSTGNPKGAVHRHGDWLHCCEGYARGVLGIGPDDVTFSSSKLFHAYGLGNGLLFPFHVGATSVVYPGKPDARVILQQAQQARPTLFFSVPTLYAAMLQEADGSSLYRLDTVRLGVSAAEPLPADVYRRWKERFGFEILDGIGSSEVLHIYVSSRPGRVRPGSSGWPVPGYQASVRDDQGRELPPGEVGDLWVRGSSTASCYWNRPQLTQERMRGEWFFTGDKYWADPDGCLWYAGRFDDMFRVSGQWVSPVEVENALTEHPAVLESAVVPYTGENRLLKPKAFVVLKQDRTGGADLARELQDFVKQRIAPYKYPRRVEFLAELPKTATGKIQRFKLREG